MNLIWLASRGRIDGSGRYENSVEVEATDTTPMHVRPLHDIITQYSLTYYWIDQICPLLTTVVNVFSCHLTYPLR